MTSYRVLAATLVLTGCGDNLRLDGEHHQYVVSELRIPQNNAMARDNGLDLDRDKTVDNQLGMIFGTLDGMGLGVGGTASEALQRGGLVMLADLQTPSFADTDLAGFSTYLGANPDPAPCLDPARLETCGQHLLGGARFTVDEASSSDLASGPIVDGVLADVVGVMPVEISLDVGTTVRLDLRGARIRLSQISEDHISGVFGGGITQADLHDVVVPQAAAQMDRILRSECGLPGGASPCGCPPFGRAHRLHGDFDANRDCQIEPHELSGNSLVSALIAPDIVVDGESLLSFGVGVELVSASFLSQE